ncbi:MaoC family dehydratase [Rhizobium sp. RU36D]|uniref:MaoC family dehydratase n=1 Tax=Rhizobium sp. RU36D TaxID=1907415 RepID=UPI0009D7D48B|nr:MaoC family dehydratase [Rhizobium sp. RU36D]SMC72412.1 Acyl dehydratase [Rhizobium sp. RU36D]
MTTTITLEQLGALVGQTVGTSDWMSVDQPRIDAFADVTEDRQFIHVDPEAARETPFGGTIAHGFLTLSLLSRMVETGLPVLERQTMSVNYGFDRLRFLAPVPSGARVRAHFGLEGITPRKGEQYLLHYQVNVEIEGSEKPALSANWLILSALA